MSDSNQDSTASSSDAAPVALSFNKVQRRILGVLLEKAYTTPDQYPLTMNSLISGSNQKSNRDPITQYQEDDLQKGLEELQEKGFIATLHTAGGRTERFKHTVRQSLQVSEEQLAILTELWLRGRQQPGELRTRASRMVAIDSQDKLKEALQGLLARNMIQTNGSLDKRGVEVDHNFYTSAETDRRMAAGDHSWSTSHVMGSSTPYDTTEKRREVEGEKTVSQPGELEQLRNDVDTLNMKVDDLMREVDELKRLVKGI
jgi:hypothetical protein